jgi:NAD(P)-dependent dehydrogenase (short-subunit alcohol dehydrogenase family)
MMAFARLDGRVAVVTGGGGLIGSAIAELLAAQGAHVAVVDIDGDRAEAVAKSIVRGGMQASPFIGNVADETSVNALFGEIEESFDRIDALVNGAAPLRLVAGERPVAELHLDDWDAILQGTLRASLLCTRAALGLMTKSGSIVNISSIHAFAGDTTLVAYPAAKAALGALTRTVATQYGRKGIRCNAVCPGTIPPPGLAATEIERRVRHQAIGREGTPRDVANAVLFLLSDESSFITGQTLTVDGGVLIHLPSYAEGGNVKSGFNDEQDSPP